MTDIWKEREKALENQYILKQEKEKLEKMRIAAREQIIREYCHNRCPKCGDTIEPVTFRGVPLDRCSGCSGIWLGPEDLQILASKDHRTWFDMWFKGEEE
jgi:hypothetical protein